MTKQPIAEVFGFPVDNDSPKATRYRSNRLCPFNNKVANCTKDKANNPLGVCSIFDTSGRPVITCPIRFRQDWLIVEDAAKFFFGSNKKWTSLTEVRLNDSEGVSAGNIDLVVVSYDERGRLTDFGSVEIQGVYISGNVRNLFEQYMEDTRAYLSRDRSKQANLPRPDYLSSSRKRLLLQLLYKGTILKSWGKKQVVALNLGFYETLPQFDEVTESDADIAWLIYDLRLDPLTNEYRLTLHKSVYTLFEPALARIATPKPGNVEDFVAHLQGKLDEKLESSTPDAPSLLDIDLV